MMRKLILALSLPFLAIPCTAEIIGPGKYTCTGRVVRQANGECAVFWGGGCYWFPPKVQDKLEPHLGKFVKVEYTRISEEEAGFMTMLGSAIGRIDKVTVLGDGPSGLPVTVQLRPAKKKFRLIEPISVSAVVTNKGNSAVRLPLYSGKTSLCQNHRTRFVLESENHYYRKHPYNNSKLNRLHTLQPGQKLQFTITSQRMVKPGTYQLVYSLRLDNSLPVQSEFQKIVILPPTKKTEYIKALKFWLTRATPGQRIDIAEQLIAEGNSSGKKEVLRLLTDGEYAKERYLFVNAFRFTWKHGGKDGESAMLSLINKQTKQGYALRMIEQVYHSKNRLQLLERLLAENHPTRRDHSGWCDSPRVCDITADWLAGYTDGKIQFPKNGSQKQRDAAVERVHRKLEQNPDFFHVLSKSYK